MKEILQNRYSNEKIINIVYENIIKKILDVYGEPEYYEYHKEPMGEQYDLIYIKFDEKRIVHIYFDNVIGIWKPIDIIEVREYDLNIGIEPVKDTIYIVSENGVLFTI